MEKTICDVVVLGICIVSINLIIVYSVILLVLEKQKVDIPNWFGWLGILLFVSFVVSFFIGVIENKE